MATWPGIEATVAGETGIDIYPIGKSNRRFQALFSDLVSAAGVHDAERAAQLWAAALEPNAPWIEESGLGQRLMLDLME